MPVYPPSLIKKKSKEKSYWEIAKDVNKEFSIFRPLIYFVACVLFSFVVDYFY